MILMKEKRIPDWFYDCARRALLGEIYSSIKAISFQFDEVNRYLKLRYYLDREVIEFDEDSIDEVATNFEAMLPIDYLLSLETECLFMGKASKLDSLDGFLYFRRDTIKSQED